MRPTICTYTGIEFNVFDPKVEDVRLEDIAHALANIPRFSGHTREFYSVAQHSWDVSFRCPAMYAAYGLLHDAAEAYLLDIPTPIKQHVRFVLPKPEQMREKFGDPVTDNEHTVSGPLTVPFKVIEKRVLAVIYQRFGLDPECAENTPPGVKRADLDTYERERSALMPWIDWWPVRTAARDVKPLPPGGAKESFLRRFYLLAELGQLKVLS